MPVTTNDTANVASDNSQVLANLAALAAALAATRTDVQTTHDAVLAGGGGGGATPGEVRTFAEGQVPAGYAQVGGPAAPASANSGMWSPDGFMARTGTPADISYAIASTAGRLFLASQITGAPAIQELTAELVPTGQAVTVPSLGSAYRLCLVPLADGNLLRLGGAPATMVSGSTQRFNVDLKTFTTLAGKPAADIDCTSAQAAQAGDGRVYGIFANSTAVSLYSVAANTWLENIATAPAVHSATVAIVPLPSGKLLWVTTTGQYIFDPALVGADMTLPFTQIGSVAGVVAVVSTATGARMYRATAGYGSYCMSYLEYIEATGITSPEVVTNVSRPTSPASSTAPAKYFATQNPYTGATIFKGIGSGGGSCLLHYLSYVPRGAVQAVKL